MTNHVRKASPADFAELKELFGPSPVLSSEDAKAYDAMWAHILKSINASDFIEQMFAKDLTDATWEMKRYSRHKALGIERQYLEQEEIYESEEEEEAERLEQAAKNDTAERGEQCQQGEQGQAERGQQAEQDSAPTTQYERAGELEEAVCSLIPDLGRTWAGRIEELNYAEALESGINYYERVDRLYSVAMARREDVLKQLDFYRQGLGRHLRKVSDDIIDGEFNETEQEAPSITGPGEGAQ